MGKVALSVVLCMIVNSALWGQSLLEPSDTFNRPRATTLLSGAGAATVGSLTGLYTLWYADYPQSGFHHVNDMPNWRQMDKLGHALSANVVGYNGYSMLKWAGYSENTALWYGGLSGWGYLAVVEVMDGFSDGWGFSSGDFLFNSLGAGAFIAQQAAWGEQRFLIKYSYQPTQFAAYRPELLGNGWTEEWLKDYNGQTYWLSVNPTSFVHGDSWWPEWLNVSVGYGATGMTGAEVNPTVNNAGEPIPSFVRGSQYYLSLDLDLTRIPVKQPWLKTLFRVINFIKIPAPALEYRTSDGRFYAHPFYF